MLLVNSYRCYIIIIILTIYSYLPYYVYLVIIIGIYKYLECLF